MRLHKHYTVFISYRRDGGFETAGLVAERLRNAGYRVFWDIESLRSGKFNEKLYKAIDECEDFILILPQSGLERSHIEDDWVRKEVLYAMEKGKNIIPVMLTGFEWPEVMPPGMEELKNYQGIGATDYQYFDASVEKLKSYLKSYPRKINRKLLVGIAFALFCLLGLWWGIRQLAIPIATQQADKIAVKMGILDQITSQSTSIDKEWVDFYGKYSMASSSDTAYLKREMAERLHFYRKEAEKMYGYADWQLSGNERLLLNFLNVSVQDIDAFYKMLYPSSFDELYHYIELLEKFLSFDPIPELSVKNSEVNRKFAQHSFYLAFYGYLELLSEMPESSAATYFKLSPDWENIPNEKAIMNLSQKEYHRLQEQELRTLDKLKGDVARLTRKEMMELEREQQKLQEMRKKISLHQQTDSDLADRMTNIQQLSEGLTAQRKEWQDKEKQLEDSYRRIIDKCKLEANDDQYLMWGKIARVANQMDKLAQYRKKSHDLNRRDKEAAIAKGYDVNQWFEPSYTLTPKDIYSLLIKQLQEYQRYFPETKNYVPAVERFYSDIYRGIRPFNGITIMGTKDDLPHPVFEIGDIVITRKGKPVNTSAEYRAVKDLPGADEVTFLRLNRDGNLEKYSKIIPQTEILVGFLQLKDE